MSLIHSDCFDQVAAKKYDIIMSNPPYVSSQDMQELPTEYLSEPVMALEATQNGLAIVRKILQNAVQYLQTNGILVVEVGCSQEALTEAFPDFPFTNQHGLNWNMVAKEFSCLIMPVC